MNKILIIGSGDSSGLSALVLQELKEKYGNDIELVTPKEAREQGLQPEDFANIPKFKIKAPLPLEVMLKVGFDEKTHTIIHKS